MAVLNGYRAQAPFYPTVPNPFLSTDLSAFALDYFPLHQSDQTPVLFGSVTINIPITVAPRALDAYISHTFFQDYYNRIHIIPNRFELGTVASGTQTRSVKVWNAYPYITAELIEIDINAIGVSVSGPLPPVSINPLLEVSYDILVSPNGPPDINAEVFFNFSNVDDPLPVVIVGNRAVVLPATPEIPVKETWKWLTDIHTSVDATEQRIGLRDVPRRSLSTDLVFQTEAEAREQYKALFAAGGRLFIPYFQYSTTLTQDAIAGDSALAFNTARCDLRDDDYVLLLATDSTALIQLDTIGSVTATLKAPLTFNLKKGTKVVSIFASILPNNLTLSRPAVNNRATMSLSSNATYPRATHQRPGSTATLNSLAGFSILARRPLANDDIEYEFDTGQEILDAETGLFDVATDWDFARSESSHEFKVRRLGVDMCSGLSGPEEMDYWRLFTDTMKGSLNNFLLSTYRPDQVVIGDVGIGADNFLFQGPTYVDNFWPAIPYRFLAITTDAGVHYTQVTGATKNVNGDSNVVFSPALPSGAGWNTIQYVSYLLKQRITDDTVELEHYALDTIIRFRARTLKE